MASKTLRSNSTAKHSAASRAAARKRKLVVTADPVADKTKRRAEVRMSEVRHIEEGSDRHATLSHAAPPSTSGGAAQSEVTSQYCLQAWESALRAGAIARVVLILVGLAGYSFLFGFLLEASGRRAAIGIIVAGLSFIPYAVLTLSVLPRLVRELSLRMGR